MNFQGFPLPRRKKNYVIWSLICQTKLISFQKLRRKFRLEKFEERKIGSCCCEKCKNSRSNNKFTRGAMSYLFRRNHMFLQNFWLQEKKKTNSFICCMFMQNFWLQEKKKTNSFIFCMFMQKK